jgi:hypothetical protein
VPSFDLDDLVEPCDEQRFVDPSFLPAQEWPAWSEADEVALTAALIAGDPARRAHGSACADGWEIAHASQRPDTSQCADASQRADACQAASPAHVMSPARIMSSTADVMSPGEVVAMAETAPLDRTTLCRLAGVDPEDLDDAGLVSFAAAWTRVANHAAAQVARAVARFQRQIDPGEVLGPSTLTSAEFSVALGLGSGGADRLVATSTALATRLPATLDALDRGALSWPKAAVLAERTAGLTPEQARRVEQAVLPAAPGRTPARHADAVRRAVDRIDPDGAAERRRRARDDIALIRTHVGDGMGELFARLPSEDLDAVWTGADAWARRAKASGDSRTLDQLRVAALVRWAQSFLSHGESAFCDEECSPFDPVEPVEDDAADRPPTAEPRTAEPRTVEPRAAKPRPVEPRTVEPRTVEPRAAKPPPVEPGTAESRPPTRHGRPVTVRMLWDLRSLLGLTERPGELADSGAVVGAETMRSIVADGVELRRLLIDESTGELVDLSARGYPLLPTAGRVHSAPVELHVLIPTSEWQALQAGSDPHLLAAVDVAPGPVRAMLAAPVTATDLDATPRAYPAPAALADFVAARDRHPTNPCAGLTSARASDLDHVRSVRDGGATVRDNLTSPTRRWHRLRTLGGWTVRRVGRGWQWTSPLGRTTMTRPYDYRLGP